MNLAAMLAAAPQARGTGIEIDNAVAGLAERLLRQRGLRNRVTVLRGDVAALSAEDKAGGPYDLTLLANIVYYLPLNQRVTLFQALGKLLSENGILPETTTAAMPDAFSRHFDLLLRAQAKEWDSLRPSRRASSSPTRG